MPRYRTPVSTTRLGRPPQPPKRTARPEGPKWVQAHRDPLQGGGPGEPPVGFLTGNISRDEWPIHWALTKILGPEMHGKWQHQGRIAGGRERKGGSVPDFVIRDRYPQLVIRVVTPRFHTGAGFNQHAYDLDQRRSIERAGYQVIDVFSEHFLKPNDFATGQAAIAVVWDALKGIQRPNPVTTGLSISRA